MDDFAQKLNELLSSPDGLKKIEQAAESLGMLGKTGNPAPAAETSALAADTGGFSGGELDTIRKIMPLLSSFRQDDQNTVLLKALRPYLQDSRRRRVDDAVKIMNMLKVLPHLKDKGLC